jgi:pantoate--beta-alanine ligase
LSSRNAYLSTEERERARGIPEGLAAAARLYKSGERRVGALLAAARAPIEKIATSIDYVAIADEKTVVPFAEDAVIDRAVLAVAARVGTTRLIDNLVFGVDPLAGARG